MINNFQANFIDVNLKDFTVTWPSYLNLGTTGLPVPSWGQWYKHGFLICSHTITKACWHFSLGTNSW